MSFYTYNIDDLDEFTKEVWSDCLENVFTFSDDNVKTVDDLTDAQMVEVELNALIECITHGHLNAPAFLKIFSSIREKLDN